MNKSTSYSLEVRERAVGLLFDHQTDHQTNYESQWAEFNRRLK